MLCRYFQLELTILEDFLNAFHLLTFFRFVLSFVSFVPFSKGLPLTATHTVLLIWQIFCFSLYVTAWYLFMDASLSEVFEGLYSSRSEVSLSSWTSRRRHHSDKVQHAHLDRSTTPTILRFTLFVVNTSFTANVALWSNHHRFVY